MSTALATRKPAPSTASTVAVSPTHGYYRETRRPSSDARLVFAGFGVDADPIAFVDEGRDGDDEPGFERGGLDLRAGSGALDAGHGLLDEEIDRRRELDADRFFAVELDADQCLGHQVARRIAERFARDVHLLVGRR